MVRGNRFVGVQRKGCLNICIALVGSCFAMIFLLFEGAGLLNLLLLIFSLFLLLAGISQLLRKR